MRRNKIRLGFVVNGLWLMVAIILSDSEEFTITTAIIFDVLSLYKNP